MAQEEQRRKSGPRSFGERHALSVRWTTDDRDYITTQARRIGISDASYVVKVFNEAAGRPLPEWLVAELGRAESERGRMRRAG